MGITVQNIITGKLNYNNFAKYGEMEQKLEANMNDTRTEKNPKNSF